MKTAIPKFRPLTLAALTLTAFMTLSTFHATAAKDCGSEGYTKAPQAKQTSTRGKTTKVFTVVYATSDDNFLNVRTQPSMRGAIIGKLYGIYHGLGDGVLIEKGAKWSKVDVGNVTGWVSNKYLGYQTWYSGNGPKPAIVAARSKTTIYVESFKDDAIPGSFTTVPKGTIIADDYEDFNDEFYELSTGHTCLFVKKKDVKMK